VPRHGGGINLDKAYSKDLSEIYDRGHFGGRSGQLILRRDCQALDALLPRAPGRILDIPCGTGVYTQHLAAQGYVVTAADASQPMLDITGQRQTGATTELCSIFDLPFDDGAFDATVTLRLFSHFTRPETAQALRELRRVIRPGGRVIFDSFRWTPRRWPVLRRFVAQSYIYEIAPAEVETLVREAGLRVVGTETRYLFSPIWQRKLPYVLLRVLSTVESRLPDRWLLRTFWACTKDS
jgi:ubiquinone/menaquinone biosynthesis C-methylase UbiE